MPNIAYKPNPKDRAIVRSMASFGIPHDDIAEVLDISDETMRKYYPRELKSAASQANAKVAKTLFAMAVSGKNTAATCFWLKTRAGWREVQRVEQRNVDADGNDRDIEITVKYANKPLPTDAAPDND